ncbi:MAG: hypothetical protein IPN76_09365 [Saprospiraceae bacterium]|nr:hypothetical protein [Saprospiraceae bacterium]
MKFNTYLHFGLLIIALPAWVLLNESMPKKIQKIHFISSEEGLDSSKLYLQGFISEIDTHHFNTYNHQFAHVKIDSGININISASLIRLTIDIKDSQFTANLMEMSCMPPAKKFRIKRQRLELMPYKLKQGERLKGNYYCTAEDVHADTIVIKGSFDLELFLY